MSMDIYFKDKDGYFLATVKGNFSKENALPLYEKLLLYSAATMKTKVLVDCRGMEFNISINELVAYSLKTTEMVDEYSEHGRIKDLRTAYILPQSMDDPDKILQNIEPTSNSEFFLTMKPDEAMEWLNLNE